MQNEREMNDAPEEGAEERQQAEAVLDGQVSTEPMLTSAEVAGLAGVAKQSVGNWTTSGVLPYEKQRVVVNGRTRSMRMFRDSDVKEFLHKRATGEIKTTSPRGQRVRPTSRKKTS